MQQSSDRLFQLGVLMTECRRLSCWGFGLKMSLTTTVDEFKLVGRILLHLIAHSWSYTWLPLT